MRITSKGQITIPVEIRERAGLLPGTEVDVELDGNTVRIMPSARDARAEGRATSLGQRHGADDNR
jgi:AbrB family looped-hinge helix DNA binding protein